VGEFFQAALGFPAVLFTFLLVVLLGYWVLTLLGVIDMDDGGGDTIRLGRHSFAVDSVASAIRGREVS
jgi:hypothetical protein